MEEAVGRQKIITNETGGFKMTAYDVFPGIRLIYKSASLSRCRLETEKNENIYVIDHCRKGRIEYVSRNEVYYLSAGDLSINRRDDMEPEQYFPQNHYEGVTIEIDLGNAPECLSCFLDDVDVRPENVIRKYCGEDDCFIARSDHSIEHIFSELYSVPESIRQGYYKVKILELLLFLSGMDRQSEQDERKSFSRSQVGLAKAMCDYLTENMDTRVTLDELTDVFHMSGTQLKNIFKGVYGISIYSYIRARKMRSAAKMLRSTDETVLEIAGRYGYENGSKFAKAFRDTIGMSPREFRKTSEDVAEGILGS